MANVHVPPRRRADQRGRGTLHAKYPGPRRTCIPALVHPRSSGELDHHPPRSEAAQTVDLVAEPGDPVALQSRHVRAHRRRDQDRVLVKLHGQRNRRPQRLGHAIDRQGELRRAIQNRAVIQPHPGGRRERHVEVVIGPVLLRVQHVHVDDRPFGQGVQGRPRQPRLRAARHAGVERRGDGDLRGADAKVVAAHSQGRAEGRGHPRAAFHDHRILAGREVGPEIVAHHVVRQHRRRAARRRNGSAHPVARPILDPERRRRPGRRHRLHLQRGERLTTGRHILQVQIAAQHHADGLRVRGLVLHHPVRVLEGPGLVEERLAIRGRVRPGLLQEDDLDLPRRDLPLRPEPEGVALEQHRRLRQIQGQRVARIAGRETERELRRQVGNGSLVQAAGHRHRLPILEQLARRGREGHIDVAAFVQAILANHPARRRAGQPAVGLARLRIHHREGRLLPLRIAEAHLELPVNREELHLIRNVRQEQHRRLARRDLREVRIQPARNREVVRREIQLPDNQELAVRAETDDDLAVEDFLGGVNGEDLRPARNQHGLGERGGEAVQTGVGLQGQILLHHLPLHAGQPLVGRLRRGQLEVRSAQEFRLVDRRQGLEELDARREVVDGQPRVRLQDNPARHRRRQEHPERAQLRNRKPDAQPANPREREAALHPHEEHPVRHRGRGVEGVDQTPIRIQLQNPPNQPGIDRSPKQIPAHGDANGRNVHDRELAIEERPDVDLHTLNRPRELQPTQTLQPGHARRQNDREVGRIRLDVRPGNPQLRNLDRQPARPLEALPTRTPDAQEHPEPRLGHKRPVAEEREVPPLAPNGQRTNGQLRPDRAKTDQLLVVRRVRVQLQIPPGEREEAAQLDPERVHVEDESLDLVVLELEPQPHRLRVRPPRSHIRLRRGPIADRRRHRLARQELGATRGHEDRPVEVHLRAKGHAEIRHPNPQVVELEDAPELDAPGPPGGLRHVGARPTPRLVNEEGFAQGKPVVIHDQTRLRPARNDHARHPEAREGNRGRLHDDDLLTQTGVGRRVVLRIVVDHNPAAGHLDDVGNDDLEPGDVDAELAGDAERAEDVPALGEGGDGGQDVDLDVERAHQAGHLRRNPAAALRPAKVEPRPVRPDGHRQHQFPFLKSGLGQRHGGPLDAQRAQRNRIRGGGRILDRRRNREGLVHGPAVHRRRPRAHLPTAGHELHVDLAVDEGLPNGDPRLGLHEEPIRAGGDLLDRTDHEPGRILVHVRGARTRQLQLVAIQTRRIDHPARRTGERNIEVTLGVQALRTHRRAVERIRQVRVGLVQHRHRLLVDREPLHLRGVRLALRVRPTVGQERHRDRDPARAVQRGRHLRLVQQVAERPIVVRIRHLLARPARADRHRRPVRPRRRDQELRRLVRDRGVVQPHPVDVVVNHIQVIEPANLHHRPRDRSRQVRRRRQERTGRRRDRGARAKDRVAAHQEALQLEALGAAKEEPGRTSQRKRLRQITRTVRDVDRDRRLRQIHVDPARRRPREAHRARQREDVRRTDHDLGVARDLPRLVKARRKLLQLGRVVELDPNGGRLARFVHQPVAIVIHPVRGRPHAGRRILRQVDQPIQRHPRVVDPDRDRPLHGQTIQPDQTGLPIRVNRVTRRRPGRGVVQLDHAHRRVGHQQPNRAVLDLARLVPQ